MGAFDELILRIYRDFHAIVRQHLKEHRPNLGMATGVLNGQHLETSTVAGTAIADGAITEAKLSFDPATQAELDAAIAAEAATRAAADTALAAPTYLVQTASATLANERVLTAGTGVSLDVATPGIMTIAATGAPPTGAAGGDLSGTYPNPTVARLDGQLPAYYLARGNHTGTQLAATISDFDSQVRTSRLDQLAAWTAQSANLVYASPASGGAASPGFRALVAADIPTISLTTGVSGTLAAANGGTGIASYTTGDLLYASGATTLSALADVATGNALISGGVGAAPNWGKIGLATHVSGTLPIANGGTGAATASANLVFAGPTTGSAAAPAFRALVAADIPAISLTAGVSGTLPVGNGGTGVTALSNILGTTNQVSVTGGTARVIGGDVTLALPQSIDTAAAVEFASLVLNTLTASRALVSNGSKSIVASSVTATELGYLSGVTSAIQTQLDARQPLDATLTSLAGLGAVQGDLIYASGADAYALLNKNTTASRYLSNGGTSNNPAWAQVSLTDGVTGTLAAANGGTGIASYAVGDLLYASGATTLSKLADVATGNVLLSGGVTTAPSWGKVDLAAHVTGVLPVANGGTGATTASANAVFAGPTSGGAAAPSLRSLVAADLPNTAVAAGSYTNANITVDAQGRITAASNGTAGTVTGSGSANRLAYWSGASALTSTSTLTTDGSYVGIGTTYTAGTLLALSIANSATGTAPVGLSSSVSSTVLPTANTILNATLSTTYSAASGTLASVYGIKNIVTVQGSAAGSVTDAYGMYIRLTNTNSSTGAITNAYGMYVDGSGSVGGAITDYYGLYVAAGNLGSSHNYGIFQAGSNATNLFFGSTSMATLTVTSSLTVSAASTISGVATFTAVPAISYTDAATSTVTTVLTINHGSSGTPDTNFGSRLYFQLKSSTTTLQDASAIDTIWTTATHASRTSAVLISTVNNAGSLTERLRVSGTGATVTGDLTVTGTASSIGMEAVTAPTLSGTWVNFGSPYTNAGYWKDPYGIVHIQGTVKSGSVTGPSLIFTLPSGYRPAGRLIYTVQANGVLARLDIETDGKISLTNTVASTAYVNLDGITFRV